MPAATETLTSNTRGAAEPVPAREESQRSRCRKENFSHLNLSRTSGFRFRESNPDDLGSTFACIAGPVCRSAASSVFRVNACEGSVLAGRMKTQRA